MEFWDGFLFIKEKRKEGNLFELNNLSKNCRITRRLNSETFK